MFQTEGRGVGGGKTQYEGADLPLVIELAKDAKKKGGISSEDANMLLDWADEYNVPNHGPEIHPNKPGLQAMWNIFI